MEWLTNPDVWIGFVTLVALEIALGINSVVFSLDSVITVVGTVDQLGVMVTAVVVAVGAGLR